MNRFIQRIKTHLKCKFESAKQKLINYSSLEKSLEHLMEVAKDFHFISIGINEINDEIKNSNRFRMLYLHIIYLGIFTLINCLLAVSNGCYSLLKVNILPNNSIMIVIEIAIGHIWMFAIKIKMILAEINYNLIPLKAFYFLINDIKSKHKLTDLNYNRLAILSRIVQIGALNFGTPIFVVMSFGLTISVSILTKIFIGFCFQFALFLLL